MRIQLSHYSLQHTDPDGRRVRDISYLLDQTPDIASFTELGGIRSDFRSACRDAGYRPVVYDNNKGEGFALRTSAVTLVSADNVLVGTLDGNKAYINWVEARISRGGETAHVYFHNAHWWPTGSPDRHDYMTQRMCGQVRKHADAAKLSFFAGDAEAADGDYTPTARILRQNNLRTIWDEFTVAPPVTGLSTDVLGHYDPDRRVTGQRYKVYPKEFSDHRALSVWYDVAARGEGGGPGPSIEEDWYHPGPRDWSDYVDDSVYPLPQAVDDSGDPRHGGLIVD